VLPHRVRQGLNGPGRLRRPLVGMHPHPAEIMVESVFHKGTGGGR